MNRKPAAAIAPRTWHSLWDEMFSAVAESDPELAHEHRTEHKTEHEAGRETSKAHRSDSEIELLTWLAQASNDNAHRS